MSRSVKKVPGYTDRNPWAKRYANKRLRCAARDSLRNQFTQVTSIEQLSYEGSFGGWDHWELEYSSYDDPRLPANHMSYRKHTCSYDICDWKYLLWSSQEVTEWCNRDLWWVTTTAAQYRAEIYSK